MERQNITLSLPKSLLKMARVVAVSEDRSLSDLLRETLEMRVKDSTAYNQARDRQKALMKNGIDLGTNGLIAASRDELHERR